MGKVKCRSCGKVFEISLSRIVDFFCEECFNNDFEVVEGMTD